MSASESGSSHGDDVFGWREWILFDGKKKALRAKLDTGARTSCVHAEEIKPFEKDGVSWVAFTLFDPNRDSEQVHSVRYGCPVARTAKVKNADGGQSERVVVELDFWIGGEKRRAEFSLNTRHDMLNPVLLGRRAIREMGRVDAGRSYLKGKRPGEVPPDRVSEDVEVGDEE